MKRNHNNLSSSKSNKVRKGAVRLMSVLMITSALSCSSSAPNREYPNGKFTHQASFNNKSAMLSVLLKQPDLSGLSFETQQKQDELKVLAERLVHAKKSTQSKEHQKLVAECVQELSDSTVPKDSIEADDDLSDSKDESDSDEIAEGSEKGMFCLSVLKQVKAVNLDTSGTRRSIKAHIKAHISEIKRGLTIGNIKSIAALKDRSEVEFLSALKTFPNKVSLAKTYQALLGAEGCFAGFNPALATALALKAEESFPDDVAVGQAIALHSRSIECGLAKEHGSSIKSSYRLGLMHIWKEQWEAARDLYAKIIDLPGIKDFRLRVLFWSVQIAKKVEQDKDAGAKFKEKLLTEFPLSLHALLLEDGQGLLDKIDQLDPDQEVLFRSRQQPELNDLVRTIEAIQRVSPLQPELIRKLFDQGVATLDQAEPAFQVYFGLLLHRARESIQKFQVITALFKRSPQMMTRASLELLYPMEIIETIKMHSAQVTDPLLVLSLIRQESAFNERARSRVGALGLMQVMPRTARLMDRGMTAKRLILPENNLKLGIRYLNQLSERYGGDAELALAAYNAGPGRVDRWKDRYPTRNRILFLDLIPIKETREYVASIARNYYWYSNLYSKVGPGSISGPIGGAGDRVPSSAKILKLTVFDAVP